MEGAAAALHGGRQSQQILCFGEVKVTFKNPISSSLLKEGRGGAGKRLREGVRATNRVV